MPYIITVPASKTSVAMSQVRHSVDEALELACGFLKSGYKDVAISDGKGHRIEGRDLEACCGGAKSLADTLEVI
jgi:hypothetical protein